MITTPLIEKEMIESISFPTGEVLLNEQARTERESLLKKATLLGNLNKFKVKIYFVDSSGEKMVNTTVWAITEKYIVLKAGRLIPRERINRISFV